MTQPTKSASLSRKPSEQLKKQVVRPSQVTRGQRLLVDSVTGKVTLPSSNGQAVKAS